MDTDVLVVGGGPAGSATAVALARQGIDVRVIDKARFPRDKCCGDGLTTGALRRLDQLGLDLGEIASFTPVEAISVRSPSGRVAKLPLVRGATAVGAVARRRDLDAALLQLARRAGATVSEGCGLDELTIDSTGCTAQLFDGTVVRSPVVIAADGAWSRVRAQLQAGSSSRRRGVPDAQRGEVSRRQRVLDGGWHAWRAYARQVTGAATEQIWVWFDASLLPGYAWSFPLPDGTANIGICMRRTEGVSGAVLAREWRRQLEGSFLSSLLGPRAVLEAPARSWPIPADIDRTELSSHGGRVLYVGDAACAADPFTGEGIGQALESAAACAEAFADARHELPAVALRYRELIGSTLAREHKMSRFVSKVLAHRVGAERSVQLAGLNPTTRRLAGRWLYEDVPRTIAYTPSLWREASLNLPIPYEGSPQLTRL